LGEIPRSVRLNISSLRLLFGIFTWWHESELEVLTTGEVRARTWNLSIISLGTIGWDEWHFAAYTYDGSVFKGHLDGVYKAETSGAASFPSDTYFNFGATDSTNLGNGGYFNGTIDEVRIYNRALSAEEIKEHYQGGIRRTEIKSTEIQ